MRDAAGATSVSQLAAMKLIVNQAYENMGFTRRSSWVPSWTATCAIRRTACASSRLPPGRASRPQSPGVTAHSGTTVKHRRSAGRTRSTSSAPARLEQRGPSRRGQGSQRSTLWASPTEFLRARIPRLPLWLHYRLTAGAGAGRAAVLPDLSVMQSYAILARAASVSCRVNARSVSVRMLPSDPRE